MSMAKYPEGTILVARDEASSISVLGLKVRVVGFTPSGDYRVEVFEETIIPKEKLEGDRSPLMALPS